MSNIMNEVQKEIEKLEHLLERMRRFKLQEPKGSLKCHKKGTRTFFYQLFWDEKAKKCEEKYIRKSNMHLIKALAQKHYYANLEPIVKKNLYVLKELQKKYHPAESKYMMICVRLERGWWCLRLCQGKRWCGAGLRKSMRKTRRIRSICGLRRSRGRWYVVSLR